MIFPKPDQNSIEEFYGKHDKDVSAWEDKYLVNLDFIFPMRLAWDTDKIILKSRCHFKCLEAFQNVFNKIYEFYNKDLAKIKLAGMDLYGGIYNFRSTRGGSNLSMHSWGIAIDLDPNRNPLGKKWELNCGMMPLEIVEIFKSEGAIWGGNWTRPDPMHFQFTQSYS